MRRALAYPTRVAAAVLTVIAAAGAQPRPTPEEIGLSGYVLAPDGRPVTDGRVSLRSQGSEVSAAIESSGRFRVVPHAAGVAELAVSTPGLTMHRVNVTVPFSKTLTLSPIRLSGPFYFRARFMSPDGEPLTSPALLRQSFDGSGTTVREPPTDRPFNQIEPDGTVTIGPLPRGITTLVLDTPPLARTRLPDVRVTGESKIIDAGTVTVERGAALDVEVVDAAGAPVEGQQVFLEEAALFSPAAFAPQRTNHEGRVSFTRLASGRYQLRTASLGFCGDRKLTIARAVTAPRAGTLRTRLVIDGRVTVRLMTAGVPLRATQIWLTPEAPQPALPRWLRSQSNLPPFAGRPFGPFAGSTPCLGATDSSGRVTLTHFPPGPARAVIRLPNSTWARWIEVPSEEREVVIQIPAGFMPLRIVNADTRTPVPEASITWRSAGARVEAAASATGDALLEGVAAASGTLAVQSSGYRPADVKLAAPPDLQHEVTLKPARGASLSVRVANESGEPLANATVELTPDDPLDLGHVATTDGNGLVRFSPVPPGSLRLLARTERHVASVLPVPAHASTDAAIALSRGYRAILRLDSHFDRGPHVIRIVNDAGIVMNDLLDAASDRAVSTAGRLSLGPLPPGSYTLHLDGPDDEHQERLRIDNQDVHVTMK